MLTNKVLAVDNRKNINFELVVLCPMYLNVIVKHQIVLVIPM